MAPPCWREAVSGPSWPPLPSPVPHGLGAGPGHQDPPCAQGCLRLCPVWGNVSTCLQWVPRAPSPAPQLQAHRGRGETLLMFSWSGNSRSAPLSERRELPCLLSPPSPCPPPRLHRTPWKQGQDSRLQNWKPGHQGRGGGRRERRCYLHAPSDWRGAGQPWPGLIHLWAFSLPLQTPPFPMSP